MEVYLDGRALDSREALHQALSALLAFPAYYGKNLDALHDCLTDLSDPVHLTVLHAQALEDALGAYCRSFQRVLSDSAQENEHFTLTWEDKACPGPASAQVRGIFTALWLIIAVRHSISLRRYTIAAVCARVSFPLGKNAPFEPCRIPSRVQSATPSNAHAEMRDWSLYAVCAAPPGARPSAVR